MLFFLGNCDELKSSEYSIIYLKKEKNKNKKRKKQKKRRKKKKKQ